MKTLTLLLSLTFFLNANCQEIAKKLKSQSWYAKGDIYRGEASTIYTDKPSDYSSDVNFKSNGEIEMYMKSVDQKVVYLYEFHKDMMKIFYSVAFTDKNTQQEGSIYYKIKALSNNKDFELIPIAAADYK